MLAYPRREYIVWDHAAACDRFAITGYVQQNIAGLNIDAVELAGRLFVNERQTSSGEEVIKYVLRPNEGNPTLCVGGRAAPRGCSTSDL